MSKRYAILCQRDKTPSGMVRVAGRMGTVNCQSTLPYTSLFHQSRGRYTHLAVPFCKKSRRVSNNSPHLAPSAANLTAMKGVNAAMISAHYKIYPRHVPRSMLDPIRGSQLFRPHCPSFPPLPGHADRGPSRRTNSCITNPPPSVPLLTPAHAHTEKWTTVK